MPIEHLSRRRKRRIAALEALASTRSPLIGPRSASRPRTRAGHSGVGPERKRVLVRDGVL